MKTGILMLSVACVFCGCTNPRQETTISEVEAARIAWQEARRESPAPGQIEKLIQEKRLSVQSHIHDGRQIWRVRFGAPPQAEGEMVEVRPHKPPASVTIAGGPTPWVIGVDIHTGKIVLKHQTLLR